MLDSLWYWLVRIIVGKRPVVANVTIHGSIETLRGPGIVFNCAFEDEGSETAIMGKKKLSRMIRALRLQLRDLRNVVRVQSDRLSDADAQLERRVTASEIRHRALALDVTMLTAGAQTEMPLLAKSIEALERRVSRQEADHAVYGGAIAEAADHVDDADPAGLAEGADIRVLSRCLSAPSFLAREKTKGDVLR